MKVNCIHTKLVVMGDLECSGNAQVRKTSLGYVFYRTPNGVELCSVKIHFHSYIMEHVYDCDKLQVTYLSCISLARPFEPACCLAHLKAEKDRHQAKFESSPVHSPSFTPFLISWPL